MVNKNIQKNFKSGKKDRERKRNALCRILIDRSLMIPLQHNLKKQKSNEEKRIKKIVSLRQGKMLRKSIHSARSIILFRIYQQNIMNEGYY